MSADGRSWAWVIAWQMLQHAEKLRTDPRTKQPLESLPDLYWGWLAEAKTFAQLATADLSVGNSAGGWLERQALAEDENLARIEDFEETMERRKAKNAKSNAAPTYAPGATVRVVGGEDVPDWMNGEPAVVKKWDGSKYQVLVRNQSGAPWYVWLTSEQVEMP